MKISKPFIRHGSNKEGINNAIFYLAGFLSTQYRGEPLGMFGPDRLDRLLQFLAKHVPIKEEQGVEGLVLSRG